MSAAYAAPRRRRTPDHVVWERAAEATPSALLTAERDQLRANVTGRPVGGRSPQFYGLPTAAARCERHLRVIEAEIARRGVA